jgi:hypothetical protein
MVIKLNFVDDIGMYDALREVLPHQSFHSLSFITVSIVANLAKLL